MELGSHGEFELDPWRNIYSNGAGPPRLALSS